MGGAPESGDRFGASLAAGDIDGDGCDDLAIGAPGESVGAASGAGSLHALLGGPNGLAAEGTQYLQSAANGDVAAGDGFTAALAIGDFNGDGRGDLVAGARAR